MAASLFKWLCVGIFSLPFTSPAINPVKHPLFITVTEISHNPKDKTLEMSCKVFTNDFETALEKFYNAKVDLADAKDKANADKFITGYIQKKIQIKADGKPVTLSFVGSEKETDATWCYFQVVNIPTIKKIEINNTMLYESFDNEINIMHVSVNGERKSSKLNNPDANALFQF